MISNFLLPSQSFFILYFHNEYLQLHHLLAYKMQIGYKENILNVIGSKLLPQKFYIKWFNIDLLLLYKKKKIKTEIVGLKHNHLEFGLKLIIIIKIQKRTRYGNNIK